MLPICILAHPVSFLSQSLTHRGARKIALPGQRSTRRSYLFRFTPTQLALSWPRCLLHNKISGAMQGIWLMIEVTIRKMKRLSDSCTYYID